VSNALTEILGNDGFLLLSFRHNLWKVVAFLLGYSEYTEPAIGRYGVPVWQSGVVLAGWVVVCVWLVRRRVQPVEIVA
jgi:hypothetical protein